MCKFRINQATQIGINAIVVLCNRLTKLRSWLWSRRLNRLTQCRTTWRLCTNNGIINSKSTSITESGALKSLEIIKCQQKFEPYLISCLSWIVKSRTASGRRSVRRWRRLEWRTIFTMNWISALSCRWWIVNDRIFLTIQRSSNFLDSFLRKWRSIVEHAINVLRRQCWNHFRNFTLTAKNQIAVGSQVSVSVSNTLKQQNYNLTTVYSIYSPSFLVEIETSSQLQPLLVLHSIDDELVPIQLWAEMLKIL